MTSPLRALAGGGAVKKVAKKWYSALEKAVESADPGLKLTAERWKTWLTGRPGVKQEEIDIMWPKVQEGFDPEAVVTKGDVYDLLTKYSHLTDLPEFQTGRTFKPEEFTLTEVPRDQMGGVNIFDYVYDLSPDSPLQGQLGFMPSGGGFEAVIRTPSGTSRGYTSRGNLEGRPDLEPFLRDFAGGLTTKHRVKYPGTSSYRRKGGSDYAETIIGSPLAKPMIIDSGHFGEVPDVGENQISWAMHHRRSDGPPLEGYVEPTSLSMPQVPVQTSAQVSQQAQPDDSVIADILHTFYGQAEDPVAWRNRVHEMFGYELPDSFRAAGQDEYDILREYVRTGEAPEPLPPGGLIANDPVAEVSRINAELNEEADVLNRRLERRIERASENFDPDAFVNTDEPGTLINPFLDEAMDEEFDTVEQARNYWTGIGVAPEDFDRSVQHYLDTFAPESEFGPAADRLDELTEDLQNWTRDNNLPFASADELIAQEGVTPEQRSWLGQYIDSWNEAQRDLDRVTAGPTPTQEPAAETYDTLVTQAQEILDELAGDGAVNAETWRQIAAGDANFLQAETEGLSLADALTLRQFAESQPRPTQAAQLPAPQAAAKSPEALANDKLKNSKVTFIDELQSYRHQRGRSAGYRLPEDELADLRIKRDQIYNEWAAMPDGPEKEAARNAMVGRMDEITKVLSRNNNSGLAEDAPYKKSWPLLTLRRMLWQAAEDGSDWLAWNTSKEVQKHGTAERIANALYDKELPNLARAEAKRLGLPKESVQRLNVGKADPSVQKLKDSLGSRYDHFMEYFNDEDIGPEAMDFADMIVDPVTFDRLMSSIDATRSEIRTFEELRRNYLGDQKRYSKAMIDEDPEVNEDALYDDYIVSTMRLVSELQGMRNRLKEDTNSWGIHLTPEIRDKILKEGLPKFAGAGIAASELNEFLAQEGDDGGS